MKTYTDKDFPVANGEDKIKIRLKKFELKKVNVVGESLQIILAVKQRREEKPIRIKRRKTVPPSEIEKIISLWNDLGPPFAKAKMNSKRTKKAIEMLEELYPLHRHKIIEAIEEGHKHMRNPHFKFKPKQNISLSSFIRFGSYEKKNTPSIARLKISSLLLSFIKLKESAIFKKFYNVPPDKNKALTLQFISMVAKQRGSSIEEIERSSELINLIKASVILKDFCNINERLGLNALTVLQTIEDIISSFISEVHTGFFISDKLWNYHLPKTLIEKGMFRKGEIKTL